MKKRVLVSIFPNISMWLLLATSVIHLIGNRREEAQTCLVGSMILGSIIEVRYLVIQNRPL